LAVDSRTNDQPVTQATIAQAIADVSDKAQLLVREEIELAKTEVTEKINSLIKGVVVGAAAGIFAIFGLLFLLHGLAWLAYFYLPVGNRFSFFWGFFLVAGVLFLLGGLAGYLAARAFRAGAPPMPEMAIDEARKIAETVSWSESERPRS
jgi:hypothetical protein